MWAYLEVIKEREPKARKKTAEETEYRTGFVWKFFRIDTQNMTVKIVIFFQFLRKYKLYLPRGVKIENKRGIDPFGRKKKKKLAKRNATNNEKIVNISNRRKKRRKEAYQICHFGIGLLVKILRQLLNLSSFLSFLSHKKYSLASCGGGGRGGKRRKKRFYTKWKNFFFKEYRILSSSRIY